MYCSLLYKNKKRKPWLDGLLTVHSNQYTIHEVDPNGPLLTTGFLNEQKGLITKQVAEGDELYLGNWVVLIMDNVLEDESQWVLQPKHNESTSSKPTVYSPIKLKSTTTFLAVSQVKPTQFKSPCSGEHKSFGTF